MMLTQASGPGREASARPRNQGNEYPRRLGEEDWNSPAARFLGSPTLLQAGRFLLLQ